MALINIDANQIDNTFKIENEFMNKQMLIKQLIMFEWSTIVKDRHTKTGDIESGFPIFHCFSILLLLESWNAQTLHWQQPLGSQSRFCLKPFDNKMTLTEKDFKVT